MPRKIRQLKQDLRDAGFVYRSKRGKGSHGYFEHPRVADPVILPSGDGDDAKPYQEKQVAAAIAQSKEAL